MGLNLIFGTAGNAFNPVRTTNTIMSFYSIEKYVIISLNLIIMLYSIFLSQL